MSLSLFLPPQPTISMIEATLLLGVLVAKIAVMMKKIATLKTDTFHAELLKKDSLSRLSSDDWTCDSSSEDDGPPSKKKTHRGSYPCPAKKSCEDKWT